MESCFSGILSELLFVADRTYMLNNELNKNEEGPLLELNNLNFN